MTTPKDVMAAIRDGNLEAVRELLTRFPELLEKSNGFWLSKSLGAGHYSIAELLLEFGVPVDAPAIVAATPLNSMVADGNIEAVKWLLDRGASIERPAKETDDALLTAISNDQLEMMEFLISNGFDPNHVFEDGTTALSYAQFFEKHEAIKRLGGKPSELKRWFAMELPDFTGTNMTVEKLRVIEEALGLRIPQHLRTFLLEAFPPELYFDDALDDDSWQWLGADSGMFRTVRSYIAYNSVDVRSESLQLRYSNYLAIGTNGGGDFWCVDTTGTNESVHFYEHEPDTFHECSQTLVEHAQKLIAAGYGSTQS